MNYQSSTTHADSDKKKQVASISSTLIRKLFFQPKSQYVQPLPTTVECNTQVFAQQTEMITNPPDSIINMTNMVEKTVLESTVIEENGDNVLATTTVIHQDTIFAQNGDNDTVTNVNYGPV